MILVRDQRVNSEVAGRRPRMRSRRWGSVLTIFHMVIVGVFGVGVLTVASSTGSAVLWPSSAFYPLLVAMGLSGLGMLLVVGGRSRDYVPRIMLLLAEAVGVYACLAAVGGSAVAVCQREAYPTNQAYVSLEVETFTADGQVSCSWSSVSDPTARQTLTFPVLETLRGKAHFM